MVVSGDSNMDQGIVELARGFVPGEFGSGYPARGNRISVGLPAQAGVQLFGFGVLSTACGDP